MSPLRLILRWHLRRLHLIVRWWEHRLRIALHHHGILVTPIDHTAPPELPPKPMAVVQPPAHGKLKPLGPWGGNCPRCGEKTYCMKEYHERQREWSMRCMECKNEYTMPAEYVS